MDIEKVLGSVAISTEELCLTMNISQPSFSRFAKKNSLEPFRKIGKLFFYHVEDFEKAIKNSTRAFQIVELIEERKNKA